MHTLNLTLSIPKNRRIHLDLPPEITAGPAEILVVIQPQVAPTRPLNIADLGWSASKATVVREQLAAFAEDWDDPRMDVYNEL
jgi:hypothetical protein